MSGYLNKRVGRLGSILAIIGTLGFIATPAIGGGINNDPRSGKTPRWSNDHHHESGVVIGPDCVGVAPGVDPTYEAGWDAYGYPIIPAGPRYRFGQNLPLGVDFDIILKQKSIGGYPLDLTAGHFTFDPATSDLALNGLPLTKDCVPAAK